MTIQDFLDFCTDISLLNVEIYHLNEEKTIYNGAGDEIPYNISEMIVCSFDIPTEGNITLNVE